MKSIAFLVLGFLLQGSLTWAHPVSYKDAVGLMSYNSPEMTEILLTYSFSPRFAVATTYLRDSKSEFYIPRANFLVKRWNNEDSQGNFYLSGGAGYEKFASKNYNVKLAELVADWESRKYYIYFDHLYLNRDNDDNHLLMNREYNRSKLRLGMAPFLADYIDLNVWFILQAEKPWEESQAKVTQFLRFYMRNVLWEIGAGLDGKLAFNYMIHF